MRYAITFSELTADEARTLLAAAPFGTVAAGSTLPPPAAPGPALAPRPPAVAPAAPLPGAPPPPAAPVAPAAPPAAPPPAAPPPAVAPAPAAIVAPPAAGGAVSHAQVLQAMQAFAKIHKSAGVKPILAQLGVGKVQDIPENDQPRLRWLYDAFVAGTQPQG